MPKYIFNVTTRDGNRVDNLNIYGKDLPDAERKVRQMYLSCVVNQSAIMELETKILPSADIEEVLTLIVKDN